MTLFTGHLKHSAFPFKRIICPTLRARLLQKSQLSCATSSLKCFHKYSTAVDKEDDIFPLRYLFLKTSVDMWEEFPHGVTFDVGYKDSQPNTDFNPRQPTVVGLPGIIGTHEELNDLLLPLAKLGFRVLIPNLPGNKYTTGVTQPDEDAFTYSIDERAEFVKDFLQELGVSRVDMLVTNNCSLYPALKLSLMQPDMYRSLVMINPAGIRPSRMMEPLAWNKRIGKLWDRPYLRFLLKLAIRLIKPFERKKNWKMRDIVTYARFVAGTSFEQVEELIQLAAERPLPRFVIYSDNDSFVEKEIIEELIKEIHIPESSVRIFSDDKSLSREGDFNENASQIKPSAIDITNIQGVKFLGVTGDIKITKASLMKKLLWDYLKSVKSGS